MGVRTIAVVGGMCVVGALVLTGCSTQPSSSAAPDLVTVTASGTGHATPDALRADLSVQTQASTTKEAQQQAADAAQKVLASLHAANVPPSAISTTSISVAPAPTAPVPAATGTTASATIGSAGYVGRTLGI